MDKGSVKPMNKQSRLKVATLAVALLVSIIMLAVAYAQQAPSVATRINDQQQLIISGENKRQQAPLAATRMNEMGTENSQMAQRAGVWDVVETSWDSPVNAPTTNKLVAERRMIGPFLQEIIEPAPNSAAADIKRIDYLSFNRVEGRWKYVSMDTRVPAGLMPAASYERGENGTITLTFDPFAISGSGADVTGQLLRMQQSIILKDADHDQKDQYFTLADGSGKMWLGHRYEYVRRGAQLK